MIETVNSPEILAHHDYVFLVNVIFIKCALIFRTCAVRVHLGPIWLDNLNCGITDQVLEDCRHRGWGVHNCDHSTDVGVVCQPSECVKSMATSREIYVIIHVTSM